MKRKPDALLVAALALAQGDVSRLTFEPLAAKRQCSTALNRLAKFRGELQRDYPRFKLAEFDALPELCDRIRAQQYELKVAPRPNEGMLAARAPAALGWRRSLLSLAAAFSETGLVSPPQLAGIKQGKGLVDNLHDVIDLVTLLTPLRARVEAALGKGALTEARAAAVRAIDVAVAPRRRSDEALAVAALRDRYATLVVTRHDRLRAAFAAVVGYREAGLQVPPLGRSTG